MSEPESGTKRVKRELDGIADELYAIRPEGFAAARDEKMLKARGEEKKEVARELGKLRRPTQSAWLVNMLSREERDEIEELFGLADDLGRAQSASELQRVTAKRRELEEGLIRRARALAEEAGVSVTASMERELRETLGAALAQAEVADEVREGRLVKPASYAGFGTLAEGMPAARPGPREAPSPSRREKKDGGKPSAAETAREDTRRKRIQEAEAALEMAAKDLEEQEHVADATRDRQQALRKQVDELEERVRQLRTELIAVGREAVAADRRRDQAEKNHKAALQALERAQG